MRPLLPNPAPGYQIPATMLTYVAAIQNGLAAYGVGQVANNTYNTAQVLSLLLTLTAQNNGAAKWVGLPAIGKALVTSLINYFSDNNTMKYGNARGPLIDNYGQYCSYCGTPVQDTALAIEHCLPKAEFPSQMLYYSNFFLACPSCNSFKGSNPTFNTCIQWAVQYIANPPTIQNVLTAGFQRQIWPDTGLISWRGFPPYFWDTTNNVQIGQGNALNLNNVQVSVTQNTVQANIAGYAQTITVAAYIGIAYNTALEQIQESNFINIVQLNNNQAGVYSDRRVTNRTIAWLNALASLKKLQAFTTGSQGWFLMVQQIFITARNAGFFEMWSFLFYWISPPSVQYSVYTYFRNDSTNPNQQNFYFPGTNINDLPTQ